jgi:sec-independent protein translocase protein TatA
MRAPIETLAFFDSIGGPEVMLVLVVVLIFFGGEKLPELARGMGKAIREFKKAASDVEQEFKRAMDEPPAKPEPTLIKPAPGAVPQAPAEPGPPPPAGPQPPSDHGIEA